MAPNRTLESLHSCHYLYSRRPGTFRKAFIMLRFGNSWNDSLQSTPQRRIVGMRLARVYELAATTGHVKRFVVFGSFVTAKFEPNDVDVFLIMLDTFDLTQVTGEARLIFEHAAAQAHFGASVFWLRGLAALPNEEEAIANWQIKRDGTGRGIVEVKEVQP